MVSMSADVKRSGRQKILWEIIGDEKEDGGCASVDSVGTKKRTTNVKLLVKSERYWRCCITTARRSAKLGEGFLSSPNQKRAVCEANNARTKYLGASNPSGNARGECRGYVGKLNSYDILLILKNKTTSFRSEHQLCEVRTEKAKQKISPFWKNKKKGGKKTKK